MHILVKNYENQEIEIVEKLIELFGFPKFLATAELRKKYYEEFNKLDWSAYEDRWAYGPAMGGGTKCFYFRYEKDMIVATLKFDCE